MLLFVPVGIGLIIGLIVFLLTVWLSKGRKSKGIVYAPGILASIVSIILVLYGLIVVRGFEGAAYLFLSITILLCSIIALFYSRYKLKVV